MRQCIDQLRRKASPIAVLLGAVEADKVTLVAGISRELEARGLSAGTSPEELLAGAIDVGGTRVVVAEAKGSDAGAMRQCIDQLRRKASPIAVLLGSVEGDKVTLVAGISKELEARGLSAGNWIRDVATVVGGKGGGRPDLAQAGGKLVAKLPEALETARQQIQTLLSG
jgi:alanyl-tRNA synthetase